MTDQRIGFCCKIVPESPFTDKKAERAWVEAHNIRGTTVTALDRMDRRAAIAKIVTIIEHNVQALRAQMAFVGSKPQALRMLRIGSDVLPARTHANWASAYQDTAVVRALQGFAAVGELALEHDIRLSMHPGQYTLLCSNGDAVVDRAIEDLEYHAEVFRLMGYDGSDQRQEINIHGGARRSGFLQEFGANFRRLASDTQRWLSVENDEFSYCLDDLLPLADRVKICVDINHYWIHQGQYLDPEDPRLERVIESWRGARPEMHVAWPHEEVLVDHSPNQRPDMRVMESQGHLRSHLRKHSNSPWLTAISSYALEFWDRFDLCCEAKNKNLTANELYEHAQIINKTLT